MTPTKINIRIVKFFERPRTLKADKDGKKAGDVIMEHWVSYTQPGKIDRAVNERRVKQILKAQQPQAHGATDQAVGAWEMKEYIEQAYNAWVKGSEIPEDGTSLAAWTQLHEPQVEAFKAVGLLTVEDVAGMNDALLKDVKLPNARELRAQAKRFLKAADVNHASAEIDKQSKEIAALKEQLAGIVEKQSEKRKTA